MTISVWTSTRTDRLRFPTHSCVGCSGSQLALVAGISRERRPVSAGQGVPPRNATKRVMASATGRGSSKEPDRMSGDANIICANSSAFDHGSGLIDRRLQPRAEPVGPSGNVPLVQVARASESLTNGGHGDNRHPCHPRHGFQKPPARTGFVAGPGSGSLARQPAAMHLEWTARLVSAYP